MGVHDHRTELIQFKRTSVLPDPLGRIGKHGAGTIQKNGDRNQRADRQKNNSQHDTADDIDTPFKKIVHKVRSGQMIVLRALHRFDRFLHLGNGCFFAYKEDILGIDHQNIIHINRYHQLLVVIVIYKTVGSIG
jgi:hypothetical protein